MDVYTMPLGQLQANCYLVCQGQHCVAIDPGGEPEAVTAWLKQRNLTLSGILLTHGHFDHVGAVKELAKFANFPVYIHQLDMNMPPYLSSPGFFCTDHYDEGDVVTLGGMSFQVLSTPGHSQGSVCLLTGEALFTGDTLFNGGCGRTDFPGGSWAQMEQSLARLAALDFEGPVYPGHGPATTLAMERAMNPYL